MAISIGPTDFSGLAELPSIFEGARIRGAEQDLGAVDFNNPAAVSKRAGQLIAIGDMEGALKLQQAAQSARALNEQIAQRKQWMQFLAGTGPIETPAGPSVPVPTPDIPNPGAPAAAPAAPSPFPSGPAPLPSTINPSPFTELPPSLGATDRGLASLRSNQPQEMTPSEQIIAAAQGGNAAPAPGPQYAQAGPPMAMPGGQLSVTPGAEGRPRLEVAPPAVPDWLKAGAFVPLGSAPAAAPTTPPKPELTPADVFGDPLEAAKRQYAKTVDTMRKMPPNTPVGVIRAYSSALDTIAQGLKTPQDWITYQLDQRQNLALKRPLESFGDWQQRKSTAAGSADEVRTFWDKEYWQPSQAARDVQRSAGALEMAASDPAFVAGHLSESYGDIANAAGSILQIGQNLGILGKKDADSYGAKLENLLAGPQNTAGMQDIIKGLSGKLTVGMLGGSLGRSISDADRNFARTLSASLSNTPGGFVALAQLVQLLAEHTVKAEETATKYRQDARGNASVPEMVAAVRKYTDQTALFKNQDGSLTPQGERFQQILKDLKDRSAGKKTEAPAEPTTYDKATALAKEVGKVLPGSPDIAGPVNSAITSGYRAITGASPSYDPSVAPREIGRAYNQGGIPAAIGAIPGAVRTEVNQMYPPMGPEPPRPPGPGPVAAQSAADQLVGLASNKTPDVGSMISLRQSIPPAQAPAVQAAVIQKMGTGPSGDFDPATWAKSYSSLSARAKVGLYGGNTPGSLRSNLDDITKGNAIETLGRAVPGPTVASALSDSAQASALAAWARSYNMLQQVGTTPQAVARFKMASDNLRNNIGGDFVYTDLLPPKKAPPPPPSRGPGPQGGPFAGVPGSAARVTSFGNILQIPDIWQKGL